MKKEEHIKTVLICSKCGGEILSIKYEYEDYDYATGSSIVRTLYKCGKCGNEDTDKTVVKVCVTEVTEHPYTNEELEEMIKELQIRCANLERYLFDKAGLKEDV